MAESLVLFESVINSRWFLRTSIILFLNKIDVFKSKLPKVRHLVLTFLVHPLTCVLRFRWRSIFLSTPPVPTLIKLQSTSFGGSCRQTGRDWACTPSMSIPPRLFLPDPDMARSLTQATDTTNIRLVFAAVKETILQNALRDSGILW